MHVGGILHTEDRGNSWNPTIDIDADVHQVATTEELVLAACAGGLAISADRGATWTMRSEGLDAPYSRAVAVCGDAVLVSASNGPRGGRAAVYRGALGGGSFERCTAGLPEWFDDNIDTYCLDALNDGSFAAFGTGRRAPVRLGGRRGDLERARLRAAADPARPRGARLRATSRLPRAGRGTAPAPR